MHMLRATECFFLSWCLFLPKQDQLFLLFCLLPTPQSTHFGLLSRGTLSVPEFRHCMYIRIENTLGETGKKGDRGSRLFSDLRKGKN